MQDRYKFFKSKDRAERFAAEVNGEAFYKDHWEYELELSVIEYPEGLEEFDYIVLWEEKPSVY